MLRLMITDFDRMYAREVLPVLARRRDEDGDTDIVAAHLRARRIERPLLTVVAMLSIVGALSMFSFVLSTGPLLPPGEQTRLVR